MCIQLQVVIGTVLHYGLSVCCECEEVRGDGLRLCFFFSSRRRHTRSLCDWSSDVCSSDLLNLLCQVRFNCSIGCGHRLVDISYGGYRHSKEHQIGRASCRERV